MTLSFLFETVINKQNASHTVISSVGSETHFKVIVVSEKFDNVPLIKVVLDVCMYIQLIATHY